MKVLLIGLLLVQSIICDVGEAPFTRGACMKIVNEARSKVANEYNVANMNDLMYEKKLEKNILSQLSNDGCPEPSVIKYKNFDIYLNVKGDKQLITELVSETGSTMMACVKSRCMENGNDVISVIVDSSESPAIEGAPGFECSQERTTNNIGLCALKQIRRGYVRKWSWNPIDYVKAAAEKLERKMLDHGIIKKVVTYKKIE